MATIDASIPLGVKPPDMMGQISGLLGIQQQQQALQQQQAQAQQAQMDLAERNAAVGLLKDPDAAGFMGADGVIDPAKAIPAILKAAPRTGGAFIEPIMAGFRAQLDVQQAAQDLNRSIREDVNAGLSAAAANPAATFGDLLVAADLIKEQNPKAAGAVNSMLKYLKPDDPMEATRKRLTMFARTVLGAPEMAGPSGLLTPEVKTLDVGGSLHPGAQDRLTGEFSPAGQGIAKTIAPGQQSQIITDQAGRPIEQRRDPRGNIVGARPVAGIETFAPGELPSIEQQAQTNFENVDANRKAGSMAPQQIDQIDNALKLVDTAATGGSWATKRAQIESNIGVLIPGFSGFDNATKIQELEKFTERIASDASKVLGVNAKTDAERESIHRQNANVGYTPDAIRAVLKYTKAQTLAMEAKANAQESWLSKPGNKITNQHEFEIAFRKAYDPRVFQFESMTPAEQDEFLKKASKDDKKALRESTRALMDLGAIPSE